MCFLSFVVQVHVMCYNNIEELQKFGQFIFEEYLRIETETILLLGIREHNMQNSGPNCFRKE